MPSKPISDSQVRDILIALELCLSLDIPLFSAMEVAAEGGATDLAHSLAFELERGALQGPISVLERLAEARRSEWWSVLLDSLGDAQMRGVPPQRAVAAVVTAIDTAIETRIKREREKMPLPLLVAMVFGVLLPLLVLVGWPVMELLFEGLRGIRF